MWRIPDAAAEQDSAVVGSAVGPDTATERETAVDSDTATAAAEWGNQRMEGGTELQAERGTAEGDQRTELDIAESDR